MNIVSAVSWTDIPTEVMATSTICNQDSVSVPHQRCALFYRLLHSSTRHIEKVEGGERDTQLLHVNEATAV